ncbi:hypothetical protein F66182_454 [Fusarium sp. NRRL 66182]|nr:hypothetical protein F66182_454 [Fusarium sp. NRRL 66182]
MDDISVDQDLSVNAGDQGQRFVICFDYGTTYTGVAWTFVDGQHQTRLDDVHVVKNWSSDYIQEKVPSLFTYTPIQGRRWGFGIGNNPFVIQRPKLELPKPEPVQALRTLTRTVEHAFILRQALQKSAHQQHALIPIHVTKSPYDAIKDYLIRVAKAARVSIERARPDQLKFFPIDIVVTHPVQWDPRAKALTLEAVHTAFQYSFPHSTIGVCRLATESEACAQYTLEAAKSEGLVDIQKKQCFVVVDAGGGTVDLVSYLVESISPFSIKKITMVDGAKCGATCIDDEFLFRYLPAKLGREYEELAPHVLEQLHQDPGGGQIVLTKGLQSMLERFQNIKHGFKGPQRPGQTEHPEVLELPSGIGNRNDLARGIRDGLLLITNTDLEKMFSVSVPKILNLIDKQITAVENKGLQVAAIFLSGGFSESKYLVQCVRELAEERDVSLHQAHNSWSAVARGGVLMGVGNGIERRLAPEALRCPYHIGVVLSERWVEYAHDPDQEYKDRFGHASLAKGNIKWIVSKGDLIDPNKGSIDMTQPVVQKFAKTNNLSGRLTVVFDKQDYKEGAPPARYNPGADAMIEELDFRLPPLKNGQLLAGGIYKVDMELKVEVNSAGTSLQFLISKRPEQGVQGRVLITGSHPFD